MQSGKIYIITNDINDKVYIGQTIQSLNSRFTQHIYKSKSRHSKIANAIRKYGREHFKISLIEDNISASELNEKEKYYIQKYNSVENGYNIKTEEERVKSIKKNFEKEIIDLYKQKYPQWKIAKKYKLDKRTVSSILKENNIPIRNWNKEQQNENVTKEYLYKEYVINKKSINKIAKEIGLSRQAITNWLYKYDFKCHA